MAVEYDGCLCNASTLLWQKLGSISMFERELEMLFFLNSPLLLFLIWSTLWFSRVCCRPFCQSFNYHGAADTWVVPLPHQPRSASSDLIRTNASLSLANVFPSVTVTGWGKPFATEYKKLQKAWKWAVQLLRKVWRITGYIILWSKLVVDVRLAHLTWALEKAIKIISNYKYQVLHTSLITLIS